MPTQPIRLDPAKTEGKPSAPAAIVMFSDFECPFCGEFARESLPKIVDQYVRTGRIRLSFKNFPLVSIHKSAAMAAIAADCAAQQGKFWDIHDRIFGAPRGRLTDGDLRGYAIAAGVKQDSFNQCLAASSVDSLNADIALGRDLGVTGTPTFFLGTASGSDVTVRKRLTGAKSAEEFKASIEGLLSGR